MSNHHQVISDFGFTSPVHILAPFQHVRGGEWQMIDLYHHIKDHLPATLWSPKPPSSAFNVAANIEQIKPYSGAIPHGGTLVIGGCTTEIGNWYEHVKFDKIVVVHNELNPQQLYMMLNRLNYLNNPTIEVRYVVSFVSGITGIKGGIQYHHPNSPRFNQLRQVQRNYPLPANEAHHNFTIGRCSRDQLNKHHFRDPTLYKRLQAHGCHIKLLGATCLQPWLENSPNIELLPEQAHHQLAQYLISIDCFFYRTCIAYKENFGTVVLEAMLSGLPVVCHRQGGYAELIRDGENGFLFDTDEEAFDIIMQLKTQNGLAERIGRNASTIKHHHLLA